MPTVTAPILTGERVILRPVRSDDASVRQRYGWHAGIERNYGRDVQTGPMTPVEAQQWLEAVQAENSDTYWAIEFAGELVGVAFLHSLREIDRKARFAVGLFAPDHIGRGLGADATSTVLRHAFGALELHRVDLRVLAFNEPAIRSYLRCGFVVEGRERESCQINGQWYDDLIMGIIKSDYERSRL